MKGLKIMRELNEQELEQVAGGSWVFNYVSQEQAGGTALAGNGIAYSKSFVGSTHGPLTSTSFASNKSFAYGTASAVESQAISNSGVAITHS